MKKSTKSFLATTLIVSSLSLAGIASAMPFGDGPEGCERGGHKMGSDHKHELRGFNVDRMAKKLDLTDDQRVQIEAIVEESKQSDLREKMQANREQLRELMQQSPLDETEVRRVADAQGDLKADMIMLRAQQRARINAILTDDQRAQLEDMRGKKHMRGTKYWNRGF